MTDNEILIDQLISFEWRYLDSKSTAFVLIAVRDTLVAVTDWVNDSSRRDLMNDIRFLERINMSR